MFLEEERKPWRQRELLQEINHGGRNAKTAPGGKVPRGIREKGSFHFQDSKRQGAHQNTLQSLERKREHDVNVRRMERSLDRVSSVKGACRKGAEVEVAKGVFGGTYDPGIERDKAPPRGKGSQCCLEKGGKITTKN